MYLATIITLTLALLLILACIGLMLRSIADLRLERKIITGLLPATPAKATFALAQIAHLPEPVRRYFTHAIAPGTVLAQGVAFETQGRIKFGQDEWWPYTAQQLLVPACGFIWAATARKSWWRISGSDSYHAGQGWMRWSMLGWFPVLRTGGAEVTRSAAGRLALESILVPSSLLDPAVQWEVNSPNTITALLDVQGQTCALGLVLTETGAVAKVRGLRWGPTSSGKYDSLVFGIDVERESSSDGFTIPGVFKAGWELDGGPNQNLFFEAELLKAQWY
jgi:hypothetical protein